MNNLIINRYPLREKDAFQAWNSADEYIVKYIEENGIHTERTLIIEDEFGALTLSINSKKYYLLNDSLVSIKGIQNNLRLNHKEDLDISFLSPFDNLLSDIDLIVIKIPKSNVYLEYLLGEIQKVIKEDTLIIAGVMQKYLNNHVFKIFETKTKDMLTTLCWKKARLLIAKTIKSENKNDYVNNLKEYGLALLNYPNLFSYEKIDIGSRFFIENFKSDKTEVFDIVDLACGNGIMGQYVGNLYPEARLHFTDITQSALKSVTESCKVNKLFERSSFYQISCLSDFQEQSADLIVCNPPFHDKHKISLDIAHEMFIDADKVLRKDGELFVVANRHLGYQVILKEIFGNCLITAENDKFVLYKLIKS